VTTATFRICAEDARVKREAAIAVQSYAANERSGRGDMYGAGEGE